MNAGVDSDDQGLPPWQRALLLIILLFVFLVGVKGLGDGFKLMGRDLLESFFRATNNPFIGLMIGILATTLVQSSSVTTSMVVGLVAAPESPLPVSNAVPMIMGANIGTTVTNTMVSLAHMARKDEFERAFSVATCHDFFNYLTVALLLPLELYTGYLQKTARFIAALLVDSEASYSFESPLARVLKSALLPVKSVAGTLSDSPPIQGTVIVVSSGVLILLSLYFLVRVMRSAVGDRVALFITQYLDRSVIIAMVFGAAATIMVQSSSITTSLLVPLAGAGIITLTQAFPITLGANMGTTITALLASVAASGPNAHAGIVIALVHSLFNLTGILMIYPSEWVRRIPLSAAQALARVAVRSRRWALIYVAVLFYGVPALFALLNQLFPW